MFSRPKLLIGLTGAVVGGAAAANYVANDPGAKRSMSFWAGAFPIFLHYRGIQLLNRDLKILDDDIADRWYEELHVKYSPEVRDITYRLRGFYLKQCQLMSIQDDFVPKVYLKWMKDTQDNVPSEFQHPGEVKEYVAKLCREELGKSFDEVFIAWDDQPLGVASIGQVHRAVLRENGQEVAVKILVPGMEEKFRSDIRTIKSFCKLAMPQHVSAFDEIEKQFLTEFDYRKEGLALDLARKNTMPRWGDKGVVIPAPLLPLCSKHLLVMEFLRGTKLVDGIRAQYAKLAALQGRTLEDLEAERKDLMEKGQFEFKTIEEEKAFREKTAWLLFLNDLWTKNLWRGLFNCSPARLIYGPVPFEWTEQPIDLGYTLELLSQVQASNIFKDGVFNGDAHPGNILLLEDGRLGLIDYGQMKTMTEEDRVKYAKLIIAHARGDKDEVVRIHFDEQGTITKHRNTEVAYLMSSFYNDRDTKDVCGDMNLASFIDWLEAQDPMVQLPEQYLFAARSSLMLRGMGKAFGLKIRIAKMWENEARAYLNSKGVEY